MAAPPTPSATPLKKQLTVPSIYAEFLPKLGRVSVVIHLPTPSTYLTKALISADASRLIVYHEGVTTELTLPVKSMLAGEHLPGEIPPGLDKMSWRLIPRRDELTANSASSLGGMEEVVPWSALDLQPNIDVVCRNCETVIVSREDVKEWKDLPSENWAEMMEFWHCHKPTTNNDRGTNGTNGHASNEHNAAGSNTNGEISNGHGVRDDKKASESELASRGYGANSTISAQEGVAFVDLTKFMFHTEDTRRLMMAPEEVQVGPVAVNPAQTPHNTSFAAVCLGCSTQLGLYELCSKGVSLFKWKVKFANVPNNTMMLGSSPTLSHCLASALVATQARTGSAKVVLQGNKEAITVWILNPCIKFSCKDKQKVSAMKLLFQDKALNEDEIDLPDGVVKEIRQILHKSNDYLPLDEKTTQFSAVEGAWTVALLERMQH